MVIVIIALVVLAAAFLILRGSEDRWICRDGQWVKHGQPSSPKPTEPCEENGEGENGGELVITNFNECVEAGYEIMESYPRKCRTSDGETFIEDIGNELEKLDLIRLNSPRPNQEVSSPLLIEGEARGTWFFEGDFPVKLLDENGDLLAVSFATSKGEWMTAEFVAFEASLEFPATTSTKGTLLLIKDNPSDLPEFDDELQVPLRFKTPDG